jgi:hypothetical protein
LGYSKAVFRVVAELFETAAGEQSSGVLRTFDDFAIALALDSGLPLDEVSKRLSNEMNASRVTAASLARSHALKPSPSSLK